MRPRAGLFALGASVCQITLLLPSLAFASSLCPEEARDPALGHGSVCVLRDGDLCLQREWRSMDASLQVSGLAVP